MSATIHWRNSSKDPYLRNVGSPSQFIKAMEHAFGAFPCELSNKDIPVLRGMEAVEPGPYQEIIALIEEHGSIELYATY